MNGLRNLIERISESTKLKLTVVVLAVIVVGAVSVGAVGVSRHNKVQNTNTMQNSNPTASPDTTAEALAITESAMPTQSPETSASQTPVVSQSPNTSSAPAAIIPTASAQGETTQELSENEENQQEEQAQNICTFSIDCSTILDNINQLTRSKREFVPSDGYIMPPETLEFEDGETVFSLLQRLTREKGIPFEYSETPVYSSYYVEGIANFYEFDCGALSGWVYRVNGEFPQYSASQYELNDGDVVEWLYTCDLSRDLGVGSEGVDRK